MKLNELRFLKEEWERRNPPPRTKKAWEELSRIAMAHVEACLDEGKGTCRLTDARARRLVVDAMHHFDGDRYELDCYAVLPNHVHVILRPLVPVVQPLEKILQSWKRYTASRINEMFQAAGDFWQPESIDRVIRDGEHLYRAIQYSGKNPERAGLGPDVTAIWIRPEWQSLGWGFEKSPIRSTEF